MPAQQASMANIAFFFIARPPELFVAWCQRWRERFGLINNEELVQAMIRCGRTTPGCDAGILFLRATSSDEEKKRNEERSTGKAGNESRADEPPLHGCVTHRPHFAPPLPRSASLFT